MRARANKELLLIAACLFALCLFQFRASKPARGRAPATGKNGKFFELTADEGNFLIPLQSISTAGKIDPRCPDRTLSQWDRVKLSKEGCRVEDKGSSGFARLAAGGKIPVNSAGVEEFETLPGIGEKRAQKILELRESLGGFKSFDQLDQLNWFSPEMQREMERLFTID